MSRGGWVTSKHREAIENQALCFSVSPPGKRSTVIKSSREQGRKAGKDNEATAGALLWGRGAELDPVRPLHGQLPDTHSIELASWCQG